MIAENLRKKEDFSEVVSVAGPGFINKTGATIRSKFFEKEPTTKRRSDGCNWVQLPELLKAMHIGHALNAIYGHDG